MSAETGEKLGTFMALLATVRGHLLSIRVCYIIMIVVMLTPLVSGCSSPE